MKRKNRRRGRTGVQEEQEERRNRRRGGTGGEEEQERNRRGTGEKEETHESYHNC